MVGGEKRDPSNQFVCERELLECSGVDEVLEKKRKKKSEKRRNARKEKKKERASRRKEKSIVKIEITERYGGIKKRKKEK